MIFSYSSTLSFRLYFSLAISKTVIYNNYSIFSLLSFYILTSSSLNFALTSEKVFVHIAIFSYLFCKLFHFRIQFLYSALKLSPISLNSVEGLILRTYFLTFSRSISFIIITILACSYAYLTIDSYISFLSVETFFLKWWKSSRS